MSKMKILTLEDLEMPEDELASAMERLPEAPALA